MTDVFNKARGVLIKLCPVFSQNCRLAVCTKITLYILLYVLCHVCGIRLVVVIINQVQTGAIQTGTFRSLPFGDTVICQK